MAKDTSVVEVNFKGKSQLGQNPLFRGKSLLGGKYMTREKFLLDKDTKIFTTEIYDCCQMITKNTCVNKGKTKCSIFFLFSFALLSSEF